MTKAGLETVRSYKQEFVPSCTLVDERDQIGPHHLGIGKTKKIFQSNGSIYAFYSTGYAIHYDVLDAESLEVVAQHSLDGVAIAFGGGQFCIDYQDDQLHLVFTSRNRLAIGYMCGVCDNDEISWRSASQSILGSTPTLAAPWVEADHCGNVWASVVGRDGNFHVAYKPADGEWQQERLFETGEEPWMHSCVQILPIGAGSALAVGFRGDFPHQSELVFKSIDNNFNMSAAATLAPCNVNDQLTFHFQATGDSKNESAHIVYLSDNLHVDHAIYINGDWHVENNIIPTPAFAPQICLDKMGAATCISVDYDGKLWQAKWSEQAGWSSSALLTGSPKVTISPAYGRTGYGTGGMIAAARTDDGTVPYITGCVDLDPRGPTKLYVGTVGHLDHLKLISAPTLEVTDCGNSAEVVFNIGSLQESKISEKGNLWSATFLAEADSPGGGAVLNIKVESDAAPRLHVSICDERGNTICDLSNDSKLSSAAGASVYANSDTGSLRISLPLPGVHRFQCEGIGETYRKVSGFDDQLVFGQMVDLVPFVPEPNSIVGRNPEALPQVFRRLI